MNWSEVARNTIAALDQRLPEQMTLKERKAAIHAAYPFGPREYWPYKAWCKARRAYLANFDKDGVRIAKPTGLEHLPRDPVTGRPMI